MKVLKSVQVIFENSTLNLGSSVFEPVNRTNFLQIVGEEFALDGVTPTQLFNY